MELVISWRTLVEAASKEFAGLRGVPWLGEDDACKLEKEVMFCRDMMVAAVAASPIAPPGWCPLAWDEHFRSFGESRVGSVVSVRFGSVLMFCELVRRLFCKVKTCW